MSDTTGDAGAVLDVLAELRGSIATSRHRFGRFGKTLELPREVVLTAEEELTRLADENAQLREDYAAVVTAFADESTDHMANHAAWKQAYDDLSETNWALAEEHKHLHAYVAYLESAIHPELPKHVWGEVG